MQGLIQGEDAGSRAADLDNVDAGVALLDPPVVPKRRAQHSQQNRLVHAAVRYHRDRITAMSVDGMATRSMIQGFRMTGYTSRQASRVRRGVGRWAPI